jgi:hypothetical protein
VLAQIGVADPEAVTYWGTTSGEPLPEPLRPVLRWTAEHIHPQYDDVLRSWPKTRRLKVAGLDEVLFCHGTPRSETECFTRLTSEHRLAPVLEGLGVSLVSAVTLTCSLIARSREFVLSTPAVSECRSVSPVPTGCYLDLMSSFGKRRTICKTVQRAFAKHSIPKLHEFAAQYVLHPPSEAGMLEAFTGASFR